MFEFDLFDVCCINKEITGLNVNIFLSAAKDDDEIEPHLWTEDNTGYGLVYIRNDYKSHDDIESWIVENYDVLISHWNRQITDEEVLSILSNKKERNIVNTEEYKLNQTQTQEEWKTRHQNKGLNKFIYDGIVNEDLWAASNKKIMFLLKEAYLKNNETEGNLCKWFNEGPIWKMWKVVSDWIFAMQNVTVDNIPAYHSFDYNDSDASTERVRSISVVNIKKSEGQTSSDYNDLMNFAENDSDMIQRQIAEISPKIIVCGNTGYYFEIVYGAEFEKNKIKSNAVYNGYEIDHNEFDNKKFVWAGDTLIIDFCHPANHFHRQGKYYALAALYQQALKEKTGKDNNTMMQPIKSGFKIIGYTDEFAGKIKVYDDRHKQVGEITKFGTKHTAKNARFKVIAIYEERYDQTTDSYGKKLGKGNMLVELLLKNG